MCNILFVVRTPYQLIVATKIVMQFHNNDSIDLIIGNSIAEVDVLVQKVKDTKIFHNVSMMDMKGFRADRNYWKVQVKQNCAQRFLNTKPSLISDIIFNNYNKVYIANIDEISNIICCQALLESNGRQAELCLYEDGFSTYSNFYGEYFNKNENKIKNKFNLKRNIIQLSLKYSMPNYLQKIKSLYVFRPNLLDWKPKFKIVEIPKIAIDDIEYKQALKDIFDYENSEDIYDKEYIFFEESYFADGKEINDVDIVKKIADIVGKENLMVKIHPRNRVNRFKELGYKTNVNTYIPWEVIAQNIDLSNKTLITIASGAVIVPLINMSAKPRKIIMLIDTKEIKEIEMSNKRRCIHNTVKKIALANGRDIELLSSTFQGMKQ
ncbi:MAG: hypothetical protein R3Y65_08625 [Bacillota bacterium]